MIWRKALLLPSRLLPVTAKTVTDRDGLHVQLAQFRTAGYAFEREENTPGLGCFAVALPYRRWSPAASKPARAVGRK